MREIMFKTGENIIIFRKAELVYTRTDMLLS